MFTYIRNNIEGFYVEFPEEINAEYWNGKIGTTYQDFVDGKWILLSEQQVLFHNLHPEASVSEVLDMYIPVHTRTLEEAKLLMIDNIVKYDSSNSINEFTIKTNDGTMHGWFTSEQRSNYKNSLDSAELVGLDKVSFMFNGVKISIPTEVAKLNLAQIQIYADRCYMTTEQHKSNIQSLNTIEEVDSYDYLINYPEKLIFDLCYEEESLES